MISERILIWTPSEKTNFCLRFTFIAKCLASPSMPLVWLHFPMSGFTMYASGLASFPNVWLHHVFIWSGFISQCLASPSMHLVWLHFPMSGFTKYASGLVSFPNVWLHEVCLWSGFIFQCLSSLRMTVVWISLAACPSLTKLMHP